MLIKSLAKLTLLSVALSFSVTTFAKTHQDILCPSASQVKDSVQLLDTVSFMNNKYAVWSLSDSFVEDNLHWHVITYTTGSDFNNAFVQGQQNLNHVTGQYDKVAVKIHDGFLCRYTVSNADEVFAIAFERENTKVHLDEYNNWINIFKK